MLAWLPVIGPVINGITEYLNKKQDVDLEKYKVDGQINIEALRAAADLTKTFKDNVGVQIARDIVMWPMAVWFALGVWDKIVEHRYPDLVWGTGAFPSYGGLEYLPMAFLAFMFGLAWKAMR